jgi:hypothetical protein
MRAWFAFACAASLGCSTTADALDGGLCEPAEASIDAGPDANQFIITQMNPPHAPMNACTSQELSDYALCQAQKQGDSCKQFNPGGSSASCGACLESQESDPTWGIIVFNGQAGSFNIPGCVDLELGQVAQEVPDGGVATCGQALEKSYECQDQANAQYCNACLDAPTTTACQQAVLGQVCNVFDDQVTSLCASLFSAAADAGVLACFPDATDTDPLHQEQQWLMTVGAIFCDPT